MTALALLNEMAHWLWKMKQNDQGQLDTPALFHIAAECNNDDQELLISFMMPNHKENQWSLGWLWEFEVKLCFLFTSMRLKEQSSERASKQKLTQLKGCPN